MHILPSRVQNPVGGTSPCCSDPRPGHFTIQNRQQGESSKSPAEILSSFSEQVQSVPIVIRGLGRERLLVHVEKETTGAFCIIKTECVV